METTPDHLLRLLLAAATGPANQTTGQLSKTARLTYYQGQVAINKASKLNLVELVETNITMHRRVHWKLTARGGQYIAQHTAAATKNNQ